MLQNAEQILNEDYLRALPLLDFSASLYPGVDLKDVYIICAQHVVSTTYSLFHALLKLGLDPNHLSVIGKCYSTDPQAYEEIRKLGIDICSSGLKFESHSTFDKQYRENIREFVAQRIQKITKGKFKKVIVLDDGGELISAINSFSPTYDHFVGIEQTSSGFHKLNEKPLKFPVINVARSPAKLNYESPIIAKLVVDTFLRHMEHFPLHPKEVLIIGNGPIGSQIFEALNSNYSVSTFDIDSAKSSIGKADFEHSLKKFDMIVGCTGKTVLESKHHKLLKRNSILVSASSSDREFSAASLRIKHPRVEDCHSNLCIDDIYLINCGFPINFAAEYRAIDIDELQLTRSLLLAAVLQAFYHQDSKKEKFIPLDIENQREITQQYFSIFPKKKLEKQTAI